jgi:CBS domain-containing protein
MALGGTTLTIEEALRRERLGAVKVPEAVSVPAGTPVGEALRVMRASGGAAVLVSRGGKVAGIFTERDVLNKLFPGPIDESKPVDGFMTPDPEVLSLEAHLGDALRLMTEHGYRNVPLVDASGRPAGMIAARDIVEYVAEHFPAEVGNLPPRLNQQFKTPEGA